MDNLKKLLTNNQTWAQKQIVRDPDFFTRLNKGQQPEYLWVGCCDSRMPAETITGSQPGELLVHRNIANQVLPVDINARSILQFALTVLKIRKVIIAGHYNCGGISTALSGHAQGDMAAWLCGIQDVYRNNEARFKAVENDKEKADMLSELNVMQQVINVARSDIAQQLWASEESLTIYGIIYDLKTGMLKDLNVTIAATDQIEDVAKRCDMNQR